MTTESPKTKTPRGREKSSPPASGAVEVARSLQALSLMPLHALAESRKQTIPSLLHDMTGLSKARISMGNLDALRDSTRKKMDLHLEAVLQEHFKDAPERLSELRGKTAAAPVTLSGALAPLAGWVHQLEFLPWIPLSMTKAVALAVDELLEVLLECCRDEDLPRFKTVLVAHLRQREFGVRADDKSAGQPVPAIELDGVQSITSWTQAEVCTRNTVDFLYWDIISSMDAEWNSHYFAGRQTLPLFPLVMVRPQDGLLENLKASSPKKNVYFKPVRRLLQFLYALAHYLRRKRWPPKAPTPKTLAHILYRPGSKELAEESLISNYFDGTTRLTLDLVLEHWEQLLQHFMPERQVSDRHNPPIPLIMLALQWQTLLVRDKGRSFLMPDLRSYESNWRHRREQWASQRAQQEKDSPKTSHTMEEPITWPEWALN